MLDFPSVGTRKDRLIQERRHDPYRARGKLAEDTVCPDCGAVVKEGHWRWAPGPAAGRESVCPACQRTRDGYPAGFVTLEGGFLPEHRDEILGLVRNIEERERAQHPLKRIMQIRDEGGGLLVTTTDLHLARAIGDAVHRAYEGEVDYAYEKGESVLRVRWTRD